MDRDMEVFKNLLIWVFDKSSKPWNYEKEAGEIYSNYLMDKLLPFSNSRHLEVFLPSESSKSVSFPINTFLYLEPVTKGRIMIPTFRLKCDFGRDPPEVRCYLGLFLLVEGQMRSIGFRFESPECSDTENRSAHHYYHVQMINDIGPPDSNIGWLPTRQPAIPLDANNPVKLILCMLIGLYGLDFLGKIRNESQIWHIDKYTDDMIVHGFQHQS